jgi:hypothetical protein
MEKSNKIRCVNIKTGVVRYMPGKLTKDEKYMKSMNLIIQDNSLLNKSIDPVVVEEKLEDFILENNTDDINPFGSIDSVELEKNTEDFIKQKRKRKNK